MKCAIFLGSVAYTVRKKMGKFLSFRTLATYFSLTLKHDSNTISNSKYGGNRPNLPMINKYGKFLHIYYFYGL